MEFLPQVSCIMPTANRNRFIPLAINNFLKQDFVNSELLILDDGIAPINEQQIKNGRIKYIRSAGAKTIGRKRNELCAMAKGNIIVHMDDDDWYSPDWLSQHLYNINTNNAAISGLSMLFFIDPVKRLAWKYQYPPGRRPWVAGATMAYRKDYWQQHPFLELQVGEDNQFVWQCLDKVSSLPDATSFVSIIHARNTSPKYVNDPRWQLWDFNNVAAILKNDYDRINDALKE